MKNNQTIDIPNCITISNTSSGASYYYWISVDDFALIMAMNVDKIEKDGIYLEMS